MSRKVLIRVVGAPLLLAALGAVLWWDHSRGPDANEGRRLLLVAVCAVASLEFHAMCAGKGYATARIAGTIVTAAAPLGIVWLPSAGPSHAVLSHWPYLGLLGAFVGYCLLKMVLRHERFTPEAAALSVIGAFWIAPVALVVVPPSEAPALWYLLFLVAAAKGNDMAAYSAGKLFGRRKMCPSISPNKTWEGGIAGAVAGAAAGFAVLKLTPLSGTYCAVPTAALLGFALLATLAGQVGDLVKSVFKRWAGVKDSGRLLPEFGGMLDMSDSFLLIVPVCQAGTIALLALFPRGGP
jgi:CDP-diglyceride synthetase